MTRNGFWFVLVASAFSASAAFSGNLSIGLVNAAGSFTLNNSAVQGTADVFNGAQLETNGSPSEVRLENGAAVRLSSKSSGTVYTDHAVLLGGAMRIGNFDKYWVDVHRLRIDADSPQSEAVIRLQGDTVEVASLGGSVRVGDGASMLTHVAAGTRMSFQDSSRSASQPTAKTERPVASDRHVLLWFIAAVAGSAIVIGSIAAAKGKSPF